MPKCGFVIRYQNTSNLEQHYIRGGLDHKELAGRLAEMQQLERGVQLGAAADGSMALSRTCNAPAFTAEKKARCDIKFVKWLVRKKDDELNEFIDEVTAGAAAKSTTTNGACGSYVKCGPRLSKVLRLQKMTFKKMTLK